MAVPFSLDEEDLCRERDAFNASALKRKLPSLFGVGMRDLQMLTSTYIWEKPKGSTTWSVMANFEKEADGDKMCSSG